METKETKKATLELVNKSEVASLYTILFENESASEFTKFMSKFKDSAHLQRDYQIILFALQKILENGALPVTSGKLRLYCLRLSDKILIIGNGGIKESKTYNENPELSGYVIDLQNFDSIIKKAFNEGLISIEETDILGIEPQTFNL